MTTDLFWLPSPAPSHGTVGDTNTMLVDPSHLGLAQDVVVDVNGILRSRGATNSITSDTFTSLGIQGAAQTISGTILPLTDATSHSFLYGTSASALTGFAKLTASGYNATPSSQELTVTGGSNPYAYSFARLPGDAGTVMCGQYPAPGTPYNCTTFLWGGNATLTSDTAAGTAASTRGTKAIAGVGTAWTTALINSYLFINSILVGQVQAVTSTTALTLYKGAYATVGAAAPAFKTVRPTQYIMYKGRITTNTSSAVVVGSNTKFVNQGPAGGGAAFLTGDLFRNSDGAYIGTISSIQNDTTLTLSASAAIALVNEEYYIIKGAPGLGGSNIGVNFFTANSVDKFSDRYWYGGMNAPDPPVITTTSPTTSLALKGANTLCFTKKNEPEHLDLDPAAGDFLVVPSGNNPDQINGLLAVRGGLLVFRAYDTFFLTGYSPETFRLIKILDDGITCILSAKLYKDGAIWAGQRSIWYFDGTKITDLLQGSVKRFYQRTAKVQTPSTPAGMGISNDHVLLSYFLNSATNRTWPKKNTTTTLNCVTMIINLMNGAVSFFTNMFVTTSFVPQPTSTSAQWSAVVITRQSSSLGGVTSWLLNGATLFQDSSTSTDNFDSITGFQTFASGAQIGPDVMFETVKLSGGDASVLKFWKRFLMNYSSDVSMTCSVLTNNDTTVDFPNISSGTVSADTFPVSSNVGILKRIRFIIRTPAVTLRVYQTSTTSATSQRFKLFWWRVGGKVMRTGRPQ